MYFLKPIIEAIVKLCLFQKAQQKAALSSQSVSTTLQQIPVHPLGAAIGISEAQRQRLDQQLYHMRKPSTPKNIEDLFATAAAAIVFVSFWFFKDQT